MIGKFTCPYCYGEHSISDCRLKCSYNIIGSSVKCKFGIQKYDDAAGYDWIPDAQIKKCLSCQEAAKQLFCKLFPGKEIPIEFLSMKSLPIALLGAKASGKSNYIGVLVNEIRNRMASAFNTSLSMACSKESKAEYDNEFYRPLYREGKKILGTDGSKEIQPLIFPLSFLNEKNKIINMAALTFYDTAGENLDDKNVMLTYNKYITNAKGLILLLDPLQVPNIRKMLESKGYKGLPQQNTNTADVLDMVISVIRGTKNTNKQIKIPLALVFTKLDVLEQYDVLPTDSSLRSESTHIDRGAFIQQEFENTSIEMDTLFANLLKDDSQSISSYLNLFEKISFFGVSAFGGEAADIPSKGIRPRRVLDPLLWLLAENRYIKTLKK
ncbi:MAG: hypothetical protein FWB86_00995 [Treponema sp.]|nr:hypothetical protein [Treponema sp.]MCL2250675.1 hypothetical protein [Treponema sp.]